LVWDLPKTGINIKANTIILIFINDQNLIN
jgi:hypothetical protein